MDWLKGLDVLALALASPLVVMLVTAVVCVLMLVLIAALVGVPMPWRTRRRNPDFVDTVPVNWNPVQRPLHSAKVPPLKINEPAPPVIRNLSNVPIYVQADGRTRVVPPDDKNCCGACDGSKCSASDEASVHVLRSLTAAPGLNPTIPRPTPRRPAAAPAARRRRDDDDQPYQGSYYGQDASRAINDDPPAPAPSFRSGHGGDFGGAGASSSWSEPSKTCSSPSYDGGSSSGDSGSSDSGSSGGCGGD
jgi:hypothetical protein